MFDPELITPLLPLLATLLFVSLSLGGLSWWLRRHQPANPEAHLPRQLLVIGCWVLAILLVLISLPISETTRGQLLSLTGLIITALIALSSTTLVANAMAGVLLRIVNSFHPGDYIRVGENFGRVTERGLFHTEVQTEDRDLLTLPNMHLITNPVTVVHKTGTIISATLTLGYDLHHKQVADLLKQAAVDAQLLDPFVHIRELGDFSISYRVGGRLEDVDGLITARSRLRAHVLDTLHGAGLEIVSPSFMNQRPQTDGQKAIPQPYVVRRAVENEQKVEDIIFDKAEEASQRQRRLLRIDEIKLALSKGNGTELSEAEIKTLQNELAGLEAEEAQCATAETK